jgi:hypothetical protein
VGGKGERVIGAPRAAFWNSGAGPLALIIAPSLDLMIYKMGGNNSQCDPTVTNVPQPESSQARDAVRARAQPSIGIQSLSSAFAMR